MNRVYGPLAEDHPAVTEKDRTCPICRKGFCVGERTILLSVQAEIISVVAGALVHATCGLHGLETRVGTIVRIKDGDGSPFPVVTKDGHQWKFDETGIDGN